MTVETITQHKPFWVSVEGSDGSGKSTVVERLLNHFKESDNKFSKVSMFPQCGLRDFILNEGVVNQFQEVLVTKALHEQAYSVIQKLLLSGTNVITDRGPITALAYQGYGNNSLDIIEAINRLHPPLVVPDLTIFIDTPPNICEERIQARGISKDLMESRDQAFINRVYNGYKYLVASDKLEHLFGYIDKRKILAVDGKNNRDEVFEEVLELVNERLQNRN